MRALVLLLLLPPWLFSCAPRLTRGDVIATAYRYTQVEWTPEARHVRHGPDAEGIRVDTPDLAEDWDGDERGWWRPGEPAQGMPYQWGGFDTPESFLRKIAAGKKAGDIASEAKRAMGDAGVSAGSCGIDCSGFVSRCWRLDRPYSTRELPAICVRLDSWDALRPGDILLNDRHVLLFNRWLEKGEVLAAYEAGPIPVWRVNSSGIPVAKLRAEGYAPWRYEGLAD